MPRRHGAPPLSGAGALDCAATYTRGVPHDRFARLRGKTPVVWQDGRAAGRPGAWAVLRYADVHRALTRPVLFPPGSDGVLHGPMIRDVPDGARPPGAALIDMDPPARDLLGRIPRREPADFVADVARDLPETLRNTLAGGLYALLRHPEQYARLRAERSDDGLLDSAVEEMLRWWTPVLQVWRTVRRGTVVGGVPLLAGERVVLWLVSGNHDDAVFPEPDRFVPERYALGARPHLCFGAGHRACPGGRLTRVHLRALLAALLEHPGTLRLAGEPAPLRSSARHGFERLPVRWAG
ncbi:cytochrome P450 [Actinomadura sp. GC306]|uniref:cytochrome P450 n=1 Tax=Actinomadura sp. GC306 TaxID=2530367 RepID=UPI00104C6078|nr:cytochrome P450 [Actinomadura sp. GC306]TDC59923.1 cytochrome P450 [Actinomadura sp. GC306]